MARILIVEDEGVLAMELAWAVEDAGYFVVGPEKSVEAAFETLARFKVDLALLDIGLGGETVFPVATKLGTIGIPFIFITGHARSTLPVEFQNRPVVQKPCQLQQLMALVQSTLAQSAA